MSMVENADADKDKFCDLVMKGGITSGIVYPAAVLRLSKKFQFKAIGGTSAGAIAAAVTAAAELGERRRPASDKGARFDLFKETADQLIAPGFIFSLFQPARRLEGVFMLATHFGATGLTYRNCARILVAILKAVPIIVSSIALALVGLAYWAGGIWGALVMTLPAAAIALVLGGVRAILGAAQAIKENNFGICSGLRTDREGKPALTEWLHSTLQHVAREGSDVPLLFADLWDAPRLASEPKERPQGEPRIALQLITTSLTQMEPRTLPFSEGRFWFREDEFRRLFPGDVVKWMIDRADEKKRIIETDGKRYIPLPGGSSLPVLVAARMSLSFPILISAVPLYERRPKSSSGQSQNSTDTNETDAEVQESISILDTADRLAAGGEETDTEATPKLQFQKCWFSDGGIGSNFPVHLFDGPVPRWPTFAINLTYPKSTEGQTNDTVYLPEINEQPPRTRREIGPASGLVEIASFIFSIVATMQNWRDQLQMRAPGTRERIVHVPLTATQGGFNLNMQDEILKQIVCKGEAAGNKLANDFDFSRHYWVRWRNLTAATQRYQINIFRKSTFGGELVHRAAFKAPGGYERRDYYRFKSDEHKDLANLLFAQMIDNGEAWANGGINVTLRAPKPHPQPALVVTY